MSSNSRKDMTERIKENYTRVLYHVNPRSIKHWLRQKNVIDDADEEEIMNKVNRREGNVTMLDKIFRRGNHGVEAFLEVVGVEYPDLYEAITEKPPPKEKPAGYYTAYHRSSRNLEDVINTLFRVLQHDNSIEKAIGKLTNEKVTLASQEERIHELETERNALRQERDDAMMLFQLPYGDQQKLIEGLKNELQEKNKENASLKEQLVRLQRQNADACVSKADEKDETNDLKLTDLKQQLENVTRELEEARLATVTLQAEYMDKLHNVRLQMSELMKDIHTEKTNVTSLEKYVEELMRSGTAPQEDIVETKKKLIEHKASIDGINTRLKTAVLRENRPKESGRGPVRPLPVAFLKDTRNDNET